MKTLRVTFNRIVKQKAIHDITLSKEEYEKLQKNEITQEQIVENKIGKDFGYTTVGWIETSAEAPRIDCEIGSWTKEPDLKK